MELKRERLDILAFKRGIAPSREKAKNLISEGSIFVDGKKILKPSSLFDVDCEIKLIEAKKSYVSRGGLKLEKAVNEFKISLLGLNCIDVGASTGGFTDFMLKSGANIVYAVDVGANQLDEKLRNDPRVVNLERTNIRNIDFEKIKHDIDFFSVDVSFISLTLVLPHVRKLISENALGVCLVKPQFEAGRKNIGKHGIVKDSKVHFKVVNNIINFCIYSGFSVLGLDFSPIKGSQGNIEYLLYVKKSENPTLNLSFEIKDLIKLSHNELKK